MFRIKNSASQYGIVAVILHWVMAVLIFILIGAGLYMVTLPDAGFTTKKVLMILFHKELGIWVLLIVIFRIFWHWVDVTPELVETIPKWQQMVAKTTHLLLYILMISLPLSGSLMSSAGNYPVFFYGLTLPDLVHYNFNSFMQYRTIHKLLSYFLILLLGGHIGAALFHHLIEKDNTLRRMWFFWRDLR